MASTVRGNCGRQYKLGAILQRPYRDSTFGIHQAESRGETFAVKRVPASRFERLRHLETLISDSAQHLRVHTDYNEDDSLLIYPFYRSTLLELIQKHPDFPPLELTNILRDVGRGLLELHSLDLMHADVKPDNILIDWIDDRQGNKSVTKAALGDFDITCRVRDNETCVTSRAVGNAMWRSPEAQTGRGMSKASDIYSLGLVFIFTFGGGEMLLLRDYKEMIAHGITAEQEVLTRHFAYFGLVNDSLLNRVDDEESCQALRSASSIARLEVEANPGIKFECWAENLGTDAINLISAMTNPDPTARMTMQQILDHRWWQLD